MNMKQFKGNLERMFDKNLTDLVRGIRNNKDNESKYIAQCIEEIKCELRQDNISTKCNAVAKLTYIQMLGYDISWAGFNIIEVMSSGKFTAKRVGYLAASQSFHPDTELLMLTTNMIRKDLNSTNQYDAGVAMSGLACFISSDLSRDLVGDIMTLMSSTKPYLRMKAVLMMYKVFLRYPEALRIAFPKLKEKLEDPDPGVQSAAVNVICELARKNPKNYLSLAPIFFKLMTTSTNNWMLIKIIKLFGALTPLEPRLGKKLIEPLTNLIHSTSAMSLLYECINTVIAVLISISSGMPNHNASIQLCVQKLRILIEDTDQNLKYLGLLAMSKILKTHPKSVQAHKDLILDCLDDQDESIRLRALDLLYGMVSKKNLMEIVRQLLEHIELAEGTAYRDELLYKIVEICSQGSYQYITNFEWFVTVLVELIQLASNSKHGAVIAAQLLDVVVRVQAIREFAVNEMVTLLDTFVVNSQNNTMCEVLYAASWIVGEYAAHLQSPSTALLVLLRDNSLPGHIQAVYIQNALKLATHIMKTACDNDDRQTVRETVTMLLERLPVFISSGDIEVQERSSSAYALIQYLKSELDKEKQQGIDDMMNETTIPIEKNNLIDTIINEMTLLFKGDLNPVAPKAQKKVLLPEGLDIEEWINSPLSDNASSSDDEKGDFLFVANQNYDGEKIDGSRKSSPEISKEDVERARRSRELEQSHNPNYLKSSKKSKKSTPVEDDIEEIPIAEIALDIPLKVHSTKRSDKYLQQDNKATKTKRASKKSSKKNKNKLSYSSSESDYDEILPVQVSTVVEIPEGATLSDSDNDQKDENDPHKSLNIDLDIPMMVETKPAKVKGSDKKKSHEKNEKEKKKKHKKDKESKNKEKTHDNLFDANTATTKENHVEDASFKTKSESNKKKHKHDKLKKGSKPKTSSSKTGYEEFSTPTK
ncbi:AP-3 complex subunit delta [Culicoides brevitarsis]|uniref:AP-3 complex subunit delta n=1 Tax=Culicoides brevitarsis TaxID=469753 RepID=UPI00307B9C3E